METEEIIQRKISNSQPMYTYMEKPSLLTRDESSAIKGLLMLLIVFGHTGMLTTDFQTGERTILWHWLYNFHVYVFMILPFIYGYRKREGGDIKYNLIKIGVPYCWFFILSALIFVTIGGGSFNPKGMLYAFLFGNQPLMGKYVGFYFIWFLPAMLALTIVKSIWYSSSHVVRGCMLAVSIVLWLLAIFKVLPQVVLGMYVPFSLSQAFYYLVLGVTARCIVMRIDRKKMLPWVVVIIVAITVMMYCQYTMNWPSVISYTTVYRLVLPVAMFLLLYGLGERLSKSSFLKCIGRYSLQIYLVHVYVINALSVLFLHFMKESVGLGIVIYMLTLAISIGLALVMVKVNFIHKILFPDKH